jgi:ribulose-phosphate 3-epimerase
MERKSRIASINYHTQMNTLVSPSLLSANFLDLKGEMEMINESEADWLHMDVMDGVFVPNISFGFPVIQAVSKACKKPLDVHLMIVHPENYIEQTAKAGAMMMTVHYEASLHLNRTLNAIHAAGMKAGVALNPSTPVSVLEDIILDADLILIMSVNPGFSGQKFIENTYKKITQLKQLIKSSGSHAVIEVDGGVQNETAPKLVEAGAEVLVSGNYVFKSADPKATIHSLKQL